MKIRFATKEDKTGFKPLLIIMSHTTVTVSPAIIASVPAVILAVYLLVFGGAA